jgi:hypothetical protein
MDEITTFLGIDYPLASFAATSTGTSLDEQISKLTDQKYGIEEVVMAGISSDMSALLAAKATALGGTLTTYGGYAITDVGEWTITVGGNKYCPQYIFLDNTNPVKGDVVYLAADSFSCDVLIPDGTLLATNLGNISILTSAGSVYTTNESILTPSLSYVANRQGSLWDSNADIVKLISDFDFAYDHIHQPIGSSGTYGIQAKIDSLTTSSAIVAINKTKQDNMDIIYRPYSQWTPLDGIPIYINESSFAFPGENPLVFIPQTDLLIDCGPDKSKGCKVLSTEYIAPSAGSYTECVIVSDVESYISGTGSYVDLSFSNDLLSVMLLNGTPITGIEYNDEVSFNCPNDQATYLQVGTRLMCTFSGAYPTRYFKVYGTETKSNSFAGYLIITLTNGLPITNNIEIINIIG